MRLLPFALSLLLMAALTGCTPAAAFPEPAAEPTVTQPKETIPATTLPPETTLPPDPLDLLIEQMTLREKVGQLFIVKPEALDPSVESCTALTDGITQGLAQYPVGGFILFAGNLISPEQVSSLTASLTDACSIAPFLAIDEEGGIVARLANNKTFGLPRYKSAAATSSEEAALEMGRTIGGYLQQYGFNLNFAPVADVNTNPNNPVIGSRAFSSQPEAAGKMAAAMAEGLRETDIIPTFKHFPGHGDTAEDSHAGIAVSQKSVEELAACEFIPFAEAAATDCVMVGHIALPEVTGNLTPATLSRLIVTGLLKDQLGFDGLVITDAMDMRAITGTYSSADAAVLALQAGCDLILMPENLPEAFEGVLAALEDGRLKEEWLEETVRKILSFKQLHSIGVRE